MRGSLVRSVLRLARTGYEGTVRPEAAAQPFDQVSWASTIFGADDGLQVQPSCRAQPVLDGPGK